MHYDNEKQNKLNEDFGLEILRGVIKWQNRNREYVGSMFRLYKM
jgi:hypothetical protein